MHTGSWSTSSSPPRSRVVRTSSIAEADKLPCPRLSAHASRPWYGSLMASVPPRAQATKPSARTAVDGTPVPDAALAGVDLDELDAPDDVDGAAVVHWLETGEGNPWPERS